MSNRILILDDERGIAALMKNYFEMSGCQFHIAYDGNKGIKLEYIQP